MIELPKDMLADALHRFNNVKIYEGPPGKSQDVSQARVNSMLKNTFETPQEALEKIRGTNNLTSVSFLLRGYEVAQAIGLVYDTRKSEDNCAIGTGFLIAPNLMITNHHVIEKAQKDLAGASYAFRLNYQRDLEGQIEPFYVFKFDNNTFVSVPELDFTIIGVQPMDIDNKTPLSDFGYLQLSEDRGKISEGEFCTLIQHPDGKPKQLALFENSIVYARDGDYLLYTTDTDGGSSGSPVFNYEWTVVGLHHAGIPVSFEELRKTSDSKISEKGFDSQANEGIRISSIVARVKAEDNTCYQKISQAHKVDVRNSLPRNPYKYARPVAIITDEKGNQTLTENLEKNKPVEAGNKSNQIQNQKTMNQETNVIHFNLPLEIRIGNGYVEQAISSTETDLEKRKKKTNQGDDSSSNFADREGYNPKFIDGLDLPLKSFYKPFLDKGAIPSLVNSNEKELKYTHFSLVMHKARRMCIITGVNIDGKKAQQLGRVDKWVLDSRLDARYQLDNSIYTNNDLDRGHMVRREDPVWGELASQANIDTFNYCNACPQHKDLNQKTWVSLENYVLKNTKVHALQVSVFTGPVLDDNYVHYREALVPVQFYKIVAMKKTDGNFSVTGYVLSQKDLLSGLEKVKTEFVFGEFATYQVPLSKIEEMTTLDLGSIKEFDPLKGELEGALREINFEDDIRL